MDGKVDWMAYGLPVEGEDGPFVGQQVQPVATCEVGATVADARRALEESGEDLLVVVAEGLAVGQVEADELTQHAEEEPLLDVMSPVPSTYRPSVTVEALAEDGGDGRHLVTTSDGRLLGAVTIEAHDHEHDHDRFERDLTELMAAIGERFGDREPSEDELRGFLRERLVSEGRSEEEADRFLGEMQTG
ncbi:MAG TPA: hypothetical protein VHF27_08535 [Acidimicrobiales bacterium]|nr:hypothetical protein [Acidimicrobiales bacterium]